MLRSMTGYGKIAAAFGGKMVTVELRALNSKYLDLNLKMPSLLREKELELREMISEIVQRGKVELNVEFASADAKQYSINRDILKQYYSELLTVSQELNISQDNLLETVIKIPDVISTANYQLTDADYLQFKKMVQSAGEQFNEFRKAEGKHLYDDIAMRVGYIEMLSEKLRAVEENRKPLMREKLMQKMQEVKENLDLARLEQEIMYYAERMDVTEELVRLTSHCRFFLEVAADEQPVKGKKLGFIAQEMGREINTLGAKAGDAEIQKMVVEMKDELEKIKEQINNIL